MILSDFTVLDLETTGLNPRTDKIIEAGAVRVRNGVITERFATFVNPGRKLDGRITELTGIRDELLTDAPGTEEVIPELLDFIGNDILVGHRVLFDYSFVKKAAVNQKLVFEKQGIDTLKIARKLLPDLESKRLTALCEYYRIPLKAHRALNDAEATAVLYFELGKTAVQASAQTEAVVKELFQPQPLIFKVKKEGQITKSQKEQLYKLMEAHKLIPDCDIDRLTRSEASRLADKIMLKYGRIH